MTGGADATEIARLLRAVAQAHHDEVGAVDPQWPRWYAERLHEAVKSIPSRVMSVDELAVWLEAADDRYQVETPDAQWPDVYAAWLLGQS